MYTTRSRMNLMINSQLTSGGSQPFDIVCCRIGGPSKVFLEEEVIFRDTTCMEEN